MAPVQDYTAVKVRHKRILFYNAIPITVAHSGYKHGRTRTKDQNSTKKSLVDHFQLKQNYQSLTIVLRNRTHIAWLRFQPTSKASQ